MPVFASYEPGLLRLRFQGPPLDAEGRATLRSLFEPADAPDVHGLLIVPDTSLGGDECGVEVLKRVAGYLEEHADRFGRRAALQRERPMAFSTEQRLRRVAEGARVELEVFRSEREALDWLTRPR
ncbi:MAG: hypothetical protein H6828_16115 [Planctomycetes bacterium]|nr:hypothetical protein [Planctomycetota bacterium]